ncbi:MAG: SGNH/GDSL hydrolase family protein [Clostridia bacterium]|nr:SGNH/GDSL hydrolase family protein [Clostridia bacterium]
MTNRDHTKKRILFFGGSITCGAGASDDAHAWAPLVFNRIGRELYGEDAEMINASISGTGSHVGAFRLTEHVLPYHPDLVFVEFATNDREASLNTPDLVISGLDYIVQALKKSNPHVAIAFVYTTCQGENASAVHMVVAQHYGIPEIDLQTPLQTQIDTGNYTWSDFLIDTAHPNNNGHAFYAQHVVNAVLADKARFLAPVKDAPAIAPFPMNRPHILYAKNASVMDGFTLQKVSDTTALKHLDCLRVTQAAISNQPGDTIIFEFEGEHFGIYHGIGNNAGRFSVTMDGVYMDEVDCYYPRRNDQAEYLSFFRRAPIGPGKHTVVLQTLEKPASSYGSEVSIVGIFVG